MKYVLIRKKYADVEITAPAFSDSVRVGDNGGDSIVYVLTVTNASTPGTANITLQGSIDGVNWIPVGSAVNVTTNGNVTVGIDRPILNYYRVAYAILTGSYTSSLTVLVKGDRDV